MKLSHSLLNRYLKSIITSKVYEVARVTALDPAPKLSSRLGNRVLLKREDLQHTFSFKLRGAYNKVAGLPAATLKKGVVAASAGNHAQGVALAAQKLKCAATIVMPVTTPDIKVRAVTTLQAHVILHGDSYDDAFHFATRLAEREGRAFIPPYDDPAVIAGQGTIGMEILQQHSGPIDAIFVAIGGGGLAAGVAAYVKAVRPQIKVIGVEPSDSDAMFRSLKAGRRIRLSHVGLFADGVAVKRVGKETFKLCQGLLDGIVRVGTDDICAAIKDVFEDTRPILEPAGALAIAGLKRHVSEKKWRDKTVVAIACGANMNFDRLRFVAERAELGEHREALFAVTIPERPGSFRSFCSLLGRHSVTEFNYRYEDSDRARVFVGLQVNDQKGTEILRSRLEKANLTVIDLSQNEMAKLHVRHLVGGRAEVQHERLFRFEFPERPGALMTFLDRMSKGWNISLFHYRNHGSDFGRVLAGIQVPPKEHSEFERFLKALGYEYSEETNNIAYRLFLNRSK